MQSVIKELHFAVRQTVANTMPGSRAHPVQALHPAQMFAHLCEHFAAVSPTFPCYAEYSLALPNAAQVPEICCPSVRGMGVSGRNSLRGTFKFGTYLTGDITPPVHALRILHLTGSM